MDFSAKINYLRVKREETPAVSACPSSKPKKTGSAVETLKQAKASEFPVRPINSEKKK